MLDRRERHQHKLEYQKQLTNQLVTAVIVLDQSLVIQYANPSAEALLIKSLDKLLGKHFNDMFTKEPIGIQRLHQLIESGQEFTDNEVLFQLYDNYAITVELTASSIDVNQEPHVLLECKQIDQQKQISNETFQQQQWESARDLIRGLAHEIKNPLGGLRGAAQLLNREITPEQQEYTAMIIEQADRLTNLVDRLLGPNQLPKFSVQSVHQVIEKVYQLVSLGSEHNIEIVRDYDPSIPDIEFDQDKILQAILNIVNNAVQALKGQGKITLKTRVASNQTINGKRVKLCVKVSVVDNGPGIPEQIQDTLFYPMVSGRSDGTGIGLSISQTLVHQHQGKLSCSSRPGQTEFTILLPINEASLA